MIPQENPPRRRAGKGRSRPEVAFRASREAMLGADGLRVSHATGTVPAKPPARKRASTPPAPPAAASAAEDALHASREAMLGKDGLQVTKGQGTVPAGPGRPPRRKKTARKK